MAAFSPPPLPSLGKNAVAMTLAMLRASCVRCPAERTASNLRITHCDQSIAANSNGSDDVGNKLSIRSALSASSAEAWSTVVPPLSLACCCGGHMSCKAPQLDPPSYPAAPPAAQALTNRRSHYRRIPKQIVERKKREYRAAAADRCVLCGASAGEMKRRINNSI